MIIHRHLHINALLFVSILILFGCPSQYARVKYNYEVGSTHVAVLSVTPWEDVVSKLTPSFSMDSDKALSQSIPTTMRYEEMIIDAIRANLKLSLPTASTPHSSTGSQNLSSVDAATGSTVKDKSKIISKSSGTSSSGELDGNKKPGDVSQDKSAFEGLGRDPIIQYLAATSLFQEVRLLNLSVHDAAIRGKFRAYVVRLQVSVMPKTRNMPYDTYLNIAFLTTTYGNQKRIQKCSQSEAIQESCWENPIIVPLLVTDDIEALTYSRSLQSIRQMGLALADIAQGLGVSADFQKMSDKLQKVNGQNFNSLLSVARVSDNTLRVRLGAMQQADLLFATVPRTHNISVLLLVPEEYMAKGGKIYVDSITSFVDSINGQPLENTPQDVETDEEIKGILNYYKLPVNRKTAELVKKMNWDFLVNRYDDFIDHYDELMKVSNKNDKEHLDEIDAINATDFYLSVVNMAVGSVTGYTSFSLPVRSHCMPKQTVLIVDNGQNAKAYLNGNCTYYYEAIEKAYLNFIDKSNQNKDIFPAENFTFSDTLCEQVALTFPSLAFMNYVGQDGKPMGDIQVHLELKGGKISTECENAGEFKTRYVLKKEDKREHAPTNLKATAKSSSQINLTWTDTSKNKTGFKIERKNGTIGTYSQIATVGASVTVYSDSGLTPGTTYYYKIRAYNADGDLDYSNEANVMTVTPRTAPPKKKK